MSDQMFCFQCEQTARGAGCTGAKGTCGKEASTSELQDELTGALIVLAEAQGAADDEAVNQAIIECLFTTVTNVNFNDEDLAQKLAEIKELIAKAGGSSSELFDMQAIWDAQEDIRSLKSLILFGIRGAAAYLYHVKALGGNVAEADEFFRTALRALGNKEYGMDELLPLVLETGRINLLCMEALDTVHTQTYGTPAPTEITLSVEPGPFIVISGHDLHDLELLLEQTAGKGINVYTHGEMLPGHAYPELKKHAHLKGNFGTAWQNQQKEFDNLPAPVLFTTNCLMPVRESYADRVFTTAVVSYPELQHIGEDKDFGPVIQKALELGGYESTQELTGINGGHSVTTGFGHGTVLGVADVVIDAVKAGALKHIFLVGGCDGARPGRNYYTEFVTKAPEDTVILTLACGKYRFNDMNIGELGGLPRIMDMGQCNDAYSAIKVASALAEAFECGLNDLPLTLVLSWYEQKAVAILLTLLYLGMKNIQLGPTLPAFVSPNILNFLVENFAISPASTPDEDIQRALAR